MNTQVCPNKMEKLLLATDSCEYCEGAVREGISLAKVCNSKLYAVTVVEVNPEFDALAPKLAEEFSKEARLYIESVKQRAEKAGVNCETIVHQAGDAYEAIVKEAADKKVDTVIMGRRGRHGLKRLLMGSVTANVIGHAPCDVLVVPHKATIDFKNIVAANDGSRFGDAAVAAAAKIARKVGGKVLVVSVMPTSHIPPLELAKAQSQPAGTSKKEFDEAKAIVEKSIEIAKKEGAAPEGYILGGHPYEAIVEFAGKVSSDTIVVGNRGRTALDRLLMGSVAERVIGLAECAVLVVKS